MIIYVDGRRVKRNQPAIVLVSDDGTKEFVREAELRLGFFFRPTSVARIIQRTPEEEGPHGARVWIEVEDRVEVS